MLEFILAFFVGWPGVLLSAVLAVIGLMRRDHRFLIASALVAFPFSWVLSGFPIVRSPAFLLPALIFASAWAMHRQREMLAWLLSIPFFLTIFLLFIAVMA